MEFMISVSLMQQFFCQIQVTFVEVRNTATYSWKNEQVVKCKLHRKELRERPRQEMEKLTMGKSEIVSLINNFCD